MKPILVLDCVIFYTEQVFAEIQKSDEMIQFMDFFTSTILNNIHVNFLLTYTSCLYLFNVNKW